MPEHKGHITHFDPKTSIGLVRSDFDGQIYSFEHLAKSYFPSVDDPVVFFITKINAKKSVTGIRKVYINSSGISFIPRLEESHIHLYLEQYLPLVMDKINSIEHKFISKTFSFNRIIGKSLCVATTDQDDIVYAIRKGRSGHSRFVQNRQAEDSTQLSLVLSRQQQAYRILSIFIGPLSGPEPWDSRARRKDWNFWQSHALIYEKASIIAGSEVQHCPWVLNKPAICNLKRN